MEKISRVATLVSEVVENRVMNGERTVNQVAFSVKTYDSKGAEFIRVTAFGEAADQIMAEGLSIGDVVSVHGKLRVSNTLDLTCQYATKIA